MKVPYIVLQSMSELDSYITPELPVFCDTETCGFYGRIRLLQVMQAGWDRVILVEWPEIFAVSAFLSNHETVWHNSHYDLSTVQRQLDLAFIPQLFQDTFLLSRLRYPEKEAFSLDDVLKYYLGYDPYLKQGLKKKELQKSKWDKQELTEEQLQYAATDVWHLPSMYADELEQFKGNINYKLDMLTLRYCLDFQNNGMPIDRQRLQTMYEETEEAIEAIDTDGINVNSWQQVRPYIGEDESDDLALATFAANGNKRAAKVREKRKLRKRLSFLTKYDGFGDLLTGLFKPSARSGRLTSNDENLQQIPRALKGIFGVDEDEVLIYADYAQLELRTICAITVCRKMEELFRAGEDLHGYTAAMLFGEGWTKQQRQLVKTYNFNLLYGGGIAMILGILLKQDFIISDEQAHKDRRKWRNLWREIYTWQEKGIQSWRAGRLKQTPMGRKYKGKLMTDHLNIENQGAGAEVAKLALHYMYQKKALWPEGVKLCNFIHDSYIFRCPNDPDKYKAMSTILAECMQEAWFECSKNFAIKDLPMPVEVKVGYNWGDIENDDIENIWDYELEPYAMMENDNA